jgi:hypothetical protein
MKICSVCKVEKNENEFYRKTNNKKTGLEPSCIACKKIYNTVTKERRAEVQKKYYNSNKEKLNKHRNSYQIKRKKIDNIFKLRYNLCSLIRNSLKCKGFKKNSKTIKLLCVTLEEFAIHLGSKPDESYQLDHICPCAQAQNEEELIKLQHYTNFRWLKAEDNLAKLDNKTPEAEEMCCILLNREWI